jgi:UDP-glucose 6-dehydrogenase
MNSRQPAATAKRILDLHPEIRSFGIYGLAYKAGSSLTEESQAVMLAAEFLNYGLTVSAYDPLIQSSSDIPLNGLKYSSNLEDLKDAGLLICTQPVLPEHEIILRTIPKIYVS